MIAARHLSSPSTTTMRSALAWVVAIVLAVVLAIGVSLYGILVVGVALAPLALVVAWKLPSVVFAAYLGIPFYKSAIEGTLPVDLTVILAGLCMVAAIPVVVRLLRAELDRLEWRALALWGLAAVVVTLGALYPFAPHDAWTVALQFLLLTTAPGLVALRVANDPAARRHVAWVTLVAGIFATVASAVGLGGNTTDLRATVLNANPINLAQATLLVPLVGLPLVWRYPVARLTLLALTPIAITSAIATGSRGPLVTAGVAAVAMGIATARGHHKLTRAALMGIGVAIVLAAGLPSVLARWVPIFALDRVANVGTSVRAFLTGGEAMGQSDQGRIASWELAGRMLESCPVLGCGTGSFARESPVIGLPELTYPHNYILQAGAEYGVVGLAVFGTILILALRRALRPQPDAASTAIATITVFFALNAMVSHDLINNRILWGLMLVMLVVHHPALPTSRPTHRSRAGRARRSWY